MVDPVTWGIILTIGSQIGPALLAAAAGLALSYLSGLIFPPKKPPKPEDRQSVTKEPTQPRFRSYGRVKVGGVMVFLSVETGRIYRVIAMGQGEIDAVEEHWIDSSIVTIGAGPTFLVPESPYNSKYVAIEHRLGTASQAAYQTLIDKFPTLWTTAHHGNGLPHAMIYARQAGSEKFGDIFPRGEPAYRQVQRAAKVYDPREPLHDPDDASTWEWSENAALVILDYLTHADGMRMSRDIVTPSSVSLNMWKDAANVCDEPIELKAGGTEPRWRIWGSYGFDERPADVLTQMMKACDGILVPVPDGGVVLIPGKWEEPTITLGPGAITGFNLRRGAGAFETANYVAAQYTSPFHDYQGTDADPTLDEDDVVARGVIKTEIQFFNAPSHSQCKRLMKLVLHRSNPSWAGQINVNLRGVAVLGQRFLRIVYPDFAIDETFELATPEWILDADAVVKGLTLQVSSLGEDAYTWDAATEEGTAPAVPADLIIENSLPVPEGLEVLAVAKIIDGVTVGVVARLTWDEPPEEFFDVEARYRRTDLLDWQVIPVQPGATQAESGILDSGFEYEFQIRFRSVTGRLSDWTASETLTLANGDILGAGAGDVLGAGAGDFLGAG